MSTAQTIQKLFSYDPETGFLTWRVGGRGWSKGKRAGTNRGDGYIRVKIDQQYYFAHRIAWVIMTGNWPLGLIDHINGNKSDNRWDNLRETDEKGNSMNSWFHRAGVSRTGCPLEVR